MAGLLDAFTEPRRSSSLLGNLLNSEDGLLGMHLLAAAGPRAEPASFGQRLLGGASSYQAALQARDDRKQRGLMQDLQMQLLNAQIGETRSQQQQREAQAEQSRRRTQMVQNWLDQVQGSGPAANAETLRLTGSLSPTTGNAAVHTAVQEQQRQQNPLFNIPRTAIDADLAFNEGKGISDMIFKRGTPNMQMHNGVALDMNSVRPGTSVPTISQDGKASQLVADPTAPGGYRVIAPQGALETYTGYRDADEASKAGKDLVKVYDPDQQREVYMTRAQAIQRARGDAPTPPTPQPDRRPPGNQAWLVPPAVQAQRDRESLTILQDELRKARGPEDVAALQREIAAVQARLSRQPGGAPSTQRGGPLAAGPSTREAALGQYDTGVQQDLIARRKSIFDSSEQAGQRINSYSRLGQLLAQHDGGSLSPTGLQLAKFANSIGMKVDPLLANKEAAVALSNEMALSLRNPEGGAGMPGALSNSDREFLVSMVPGLSTSAQGRATMVQAALAVEQRKQQVAQFARNYEQKHGRLDAGFFDQLAAWSTANPLFDRRGR